jgi:hypothetical protein
LKDVGVDTRIILKWMLMKLGVELWIGFNLLRLRKSEWWNFLM